MKHLIAFVTIFLLLASVSATAATKYKIQIGTPTVKSLKFAIVLMNSSKTKVIARRSAKINKKDRKVSFWYAKFNEDVIRKSAHFCAVVKTKKVFFKVKGKQVKNICFRLSKKKKVQGGLIYGIFKKK